MHIKEIVLINYVCLLGFFRYRIIRSNADLTFAKEGVRLAVELSILVLTRKDRTPNSALYQPRHLCSATAPRRELTTSCRSVALRS